LNVRFWTFRFCLVLSWLVLLCLVLSCLVLSSLVALYSSIFLHLLFFVNLTQPHGFQSRTTNNKANANVLHKGGLSFSCLNWSFLPLYLRRSSSLFCSFLIQFACLSLSWQKNHRMHDDALNGMLGLGSRLRFGLRFGLG